MKAVVFLFAACMSVVAPLFGQDESDGVLLTIEDEKITADEFLRVYNKNNNQPNSIDPKSVEEYLELYINFKLKVKEAEALGLDTAGAFQHELNGYRKQLAQPYLTDNKMTEQLLHEAYKRMQQDVHASHILVRVPEDASPKDTAKALDRIKSIRKSIKNPKEEFAAKARQLSDDPSAKNNGGDLGYFTVFQMVYPFETAAYTTEEGEMSAPVRTRFGYHLVYVHDKRPARGEIKVAHILVKSENSSADSEGNQQARNKIEEIKQQIENGEDFAAMARQYSDDKSSSMKGGELPWFSTGRMVKEFEDAAFALKENGAVSGPVKTEYGWHLIKRIDKKEIPPFEEIQKELKRKVNRDGRISRSRESFINQLKKEYNYQYNENALKEVIGTINDGFFGGQWEYQEEAKGMNKPLFTIADNKYSDTSITHTQYDFAAFMAKNRKYEKTEENLGNKESIGRELFEDFVSKKLTDFEERNLDAKYPEFRSIVKEYRDGILLFELMDQKVWTKAMQDSSGLQAYYEKNKERFMWDERVKAKIFVCENEKTARKARRLSKRQKRRDWPDEKVKEKINKKSELAVDIRGDIHSKGDDPVIDTVEWEEGLSDNMNVDGKILFVNIWKVIPPQPKSLSEARGVITAEYQNYLEGKWVEELRSKYSFNINKKVLSSIR